MLTPEQERLVIEHAGLAQHFARRRSSRAPESYDEVLSDAYLGLTMAARSFDGDKGASFATYAARKIKGYMADGRRERDHLCRADRRKSSELRDARRRFLQREQRFPTPAELANEAGWTMDELTAHRVRTMPAYYVHPLSETPFDAADGENMDATLAETIRDDEPTAEEAIELDRPDLQAALDRLPGPDRFVIAMYFFEQCTTAEIGEMMGVTESRISQIKTRALSRLREGLAAVA